MGRLFQLFGVAVIGLLVSVQSAAVFRQEDVPTIVVDLPNDGIGPISSVPYEEEVTTENPEENPDMFQGDIDLPYHRNAILYASQKWPGGIVFFEFHANFPATYVQGMKDAMSELESDVAHNGVKCVRFVPRTPKTIEYIEIVPGQGCHSPLGKVRGQKGEVSLGNGCHSRGTIMHELLHSLGFLHEQTRPDRDIYVKVNFANIPQKLHSQFSKSSAFSTLMGRTPYEYTSVMHYNSYAFAIDKSIPTITPTTNHNTGQLLGQRFMLSRWDVQRVQMLYGCPVDVSHIKGKEKKQFSVECNFEKDECNLKQHQTDDNFNWMRRHGKTPTANTGPKADHTNGDGWYLYAEADHHVSQKAIIETPTIPAGLTCVSFVFYNYGSQHGNFRLLLGGKYYKNRPLSVLDNGSTRNQWNYYRTNLNITVPYTLILESKVGNGVTSDVAIDDFEVYKGKCI